MSHVGVLDQRVGVVEAEHAGRSAAPRRSATASSLNSRISGYSAAACTSFARSLAVDTLLGGQARSDRRSACASCRATPPWRSSPRRTRACRRDSGARAPTPRGSPTTSARAAASRAAAARRPSAAASRLPLRKSKSSMSTSSGSSSGWLRVEHDHRRHQLGDRRDRRHLVRRFCVDRPVGRGVEHERRWPSASLQLGRVGRRRLRPQARGRRRTRSKNNESATLHQCKSQDSARLYSTARAPSSIALTNQWSRSAVARRPAAACRRGRTPVVRCRGRTGAGSAAGRSPASVRRRGSASTARLVLLQPPHPRVDAVRGKQRGMRAPLDDAAVVEHEDLVGVDDRRQPVRDGQRRAVARDQPQLGLDRLLGARVERRRRLVEDQDRADA